MMSFKGLEMENKDYWVCMCDPGLTYEHIHHVSTKGCYSCHLLEKDALRANKNDVKVMIQQSIDDERS